MLTVGEILYKQRIKKGKSTQDFEKELKIREKFLTAVEKNNWDLFSSKIYISGIIKAYAKALDLDHDKLIAFFRREYERQERVEFKKKISSSYLNPGTKKLVFAGIIFIFLIFFSYFAYQIKSYLSPPKLSIVSPNENTKFTEERIKIKGQTEKEASITIFGEHIFQNKEGNFEYDFPLKIGKNEIKIEVIGANGKKTVLTQTYYRKELN